MRFSALISLFVFAFSAAADSLSFKDYTSLPLSEKVYLLRAYKQFVAEINEELPTEVGIKISFINQAWASDFNCFYAGWPSKRVSGKCTNPKRGNPAYTATSTCSSSQLLCQPLLFGHDLCVDVQTKAQRNSALSQCEKKFRTNGRTIESVAQNVDRAQLGELFTTAQKLCQLPKNTRICIPLQAKIAAVRSKVPGNPLTRGRSVAAVEDEEIDEGEEERIIPSAPPMPAPITPRELLVDAVKTVGVANAVLLSVGSPNPTECREEVRHLNRPVLSPDKDVKVIQCRPDATSLTAPTSENYDAEIADYGIEFHPSKEAIIGTREFRLFMHELRKYPAPLLREMRLAGGRIRVFNGEGVTADPDWDRQRLAAMEIQQNAWDFYNNHGKKQGFPPPAMTVQQVSDTYAITTEGTRNWRYVSGAGGVFDNPNFKSPTRIVLNRMYRSLHQNPDGKVEERDQGSVNLVLHEQAHAMDSMYGHHPISDSPQWKAALNDPQSRAYTRKIFSSYEERGEEGFAELFAYYHSCAASREQIERHAPALAKFFQEFRSVRELRPDLYEAWRKRYK